MVEVITAIGSSSISAVVACVVIACSPAIVFTAYLGIFAFNNPDKEAWYGIENGT